MLVSSLKLNNYRNYSSWNIDFDKGLNIIIGKNGVGKTNILESLIVLSNTKSFRTLNDNDLIKKGEQYSKIEANCDIGKLKVVISDNGKRLYFNDNVLKRTSEFIGKINCILFKPNDLNLFIDSPRERRRILDIEIGKVSKEYLLSLSTYNLLLKDKNRLLKEENIDLNYLDIIDSKMINEMKTIIKYREEFINIINSYISNIYDDLSNSSVNIFIKYKACGDLNSLNENMFKSRDKDLLYHYANFGIHHDDYEFYFDNNLLQTIASQGQSRLVVISFKLALEKYIRFKTNKCPIILLDDILSELDFDNKQRLLRYIPYDNQTIITGTDLENIKNINNFNLIEIKERKDG